MAVKLKKNVTQNYPILTITFSFLTFPPFFTLSQTLACRLFCKYSGLYVKALVLDKLPEVTRPRHVDKFLCVCQFIEAKRWKVTHL